MTQWKLSRHETTLEFEKKKSVEEAIAIRLEAIAIRLRGRVAFKKEVGSFGGFARLASRAGVHQVFKNTPER